MEYLLAILAILFLLTKVASKANPAKRGASTRKRILPLPKLPQRPESAPRQDIPQHSDPGPRGNLGDRPELAHRPDAVEYERPVLPPKPSPTPASPPPPPPPPPPPRGSPAPAVVRSPYIQTNPKYWLDVIRVGEEEGTRRAVAALVGMGSAALPALEEAARDPSAHVRETVASVVERIRHPHGRPHRPDAVRMSAPHEATPAPERAKPVVRPRPRPVPHPKPVPQPEPIEEAEPTPIATPAPAANARPLEGSLADALRAVAALPSFGGGRKEALAALEGRTAVLQLVVERVQWTGMLNASPAYQNGRTVAGRLKDTTVPVAILATPAQNAVGDALKDGQVVTFLGTFAGWDALYDRGRFEGEIEVPVGA